MGSAIKHEREAAIANGFPVKETTKEPNGWFRISAERWA